MDSASQRLRQNLRRILAEREMTQAELASAIGMTGPAISQILSHTRSTPVTTLDEIVAKLQLDPSDLFRHASSVHSSHEARPLRSSSVMGEDASTPIISAAPEETHAAIVARQFDARLDRLDQIARRHQESATALDAAVEHLQALLDEYNDLASAFVHAPADQQSATARTLQSSEHHVPRKSHKSTRRKTTR